jgi:phosphopantothenoylcysteine decarboxylase/phosphopantothenate--cysteine ligase
MTHADLGLPERVLLAVSGSIAAAAMPPSVMAMRQALGLDVRVILTDQASTLVSARALAAISGNPVVVGFGSSDDRSNHIDLVDWAELVLVMPATANTIAKAACGIADTLLLTCVLASSAPVVFVPAMNEVMWHRGAVQRNVDQLRADGHGVVPPHPAVSLRSMTTTGFGVPDTVTVFEWVRSFLDENRGSLGTRLPATGDIHG